MQDTVTCSSCHVRLRLPAEPPAAGMTCPRCLARVQYPTVAPTSIQATTSEPTRPVEPPPVPSGRLRCPHCGKPVEPMWMVCPYCEEAIQEPERGRAGAGVDRDVRCDSTATRVVLIVLSTLGGIYTVGFFAMALLGTGSSEETWQMVGGGLIILLFLSLVSTGFMFWRTRDNPSARGFGRVVLGTFSLIGFFIAGSCALTLAVFIFFFAICLAGGMRF